MAERQDNTTRVGFKTIRLIKDQTLGIGSYGKVCKAQCDELECAAKLMHETLFNPVITRHQDKEYRLPIKRFEQECEFMSTIRHPNIVQYLGVYHDPDTHLPALLMELMDDNLTHYLESSSGPIPYKVQVNICHNITLALSFLHTNGIIHRDLSGNNVLLCGNIIAKVTDFGMARLDGQNPRTTRATYTACPGSEVYMPPETIKVKPIYSEKVDCFSFGVIVVQILTRKFPEPGDRQKEIQIDHPGVQAGVLEVRVSEFERRQNHISTIDQDHPLRQIALDCLNDKENDRPSAPDLCERLAVLKERSFKHNSSTCTSQTRDQASQGQADMNELGEKDHQIKCLREQLQLQAQEKDDIIHTRQQEIQHIKQQLQQAEQELEHQTQMIHAKDEEIQQLKQRSKQAEQQSREMNQILERRSPISRERETRSGDVMSEQARQEIEKRLHEVEQQLRLPKSLHRKPINTKKSAFKLSWSEGENSPRKMYRECNVTMKGNSVYFRVNADEVHTFNTSNYRWSQLPSCRYQGSALTVINDQLTAIGGEDVYVIGYKSLFTLENIRQWKEILPQMEVGRTHSVALCTGTALIVAGGWNETSVEVMNTGTQKWSNAASLPEPVYNASATICGDRVYILGGNGAAYEGVTSVFTCSLSTLLQSCGEDFQESTIVWSQVANLPVIHSTCVSMDGRLLAIGGIEIAEEPTCTTAVYMYISSSNTWEIVSHMQVARSHCYAAVLPDNQLMVVGGRCDPKGAKTNTIEFATTM